MSGIKLFFAGDFCSKPSTTNITVEKELRNIISNSDISVVNFEVPLKPHGDNFPKENYERFYQNDDAPSFLKSIGFNLFAIANNHLFDWGNEGYIRTKEELQDTAFGAGNYDEAYSVKVVDVNHKKIGFLAVTYNSRRGTFSDVLNHDGYGCAYIDDLKVNHIIHEKKKELDYLFVLPHAGIEYIDAPIPELIAKYRDFIDWGADAVIASHPHCPQGWEEYQGKPIFYSLGNFFFNSKDTIDFVAKRPHWYESLCVLIEINETLTYQVINVRNVSNTQLVIDHSKEREIHNNYLCQILEDKKLYHDYLKGMLSNIEIQILPNFLMGCLPNNRVKQIKVLIRSLYYVLKGVNLSKYKDELKISLNNIAKRELIKRLLNN